MENKIDLYKINWYNKNKRMIKMTDYAKSLKDKLDIVTLSREDFNTICKDRLDFGFDSIYFRYSEVVEELSWFKEAEARREGRNFNRKNWCETRRQHFYMCLEQLTHAHEQEDVE